MNSEVLVRGDLLLFARPFGENFCTSIGSVCASSHLNLTDAWHVVCDMHQTICGVIAVKVCSAAVHNLSLL
jgi:hypothetical protein